MRDFEKVKFMSEYGTLDYNYGGYALETFNWVNINSLLPFYSTKEEFLVYFRISHDGDFYFLKEKHNGKSSCL